MRRDVRGLREAIDGLLEFEESVPREVYDLLDDLRKRGEQYIRLYAPAYSGELLRRVGSSAPGPDAAATGLDMVARAGVRGGGDHPLYVHGGTGLYSGGASKFPITSRTPGKPMRFQKRGEPPRYRMWVRGQKPNPFVRYAFQQLVPYASGKVRRLFGRRRGEGI